MYVSERGDFSVMRFPQRNCGWGFHREAVQHQGSVFLSKYRHLIDFRRGGKVLLDFDFCSVLVLFFENLNAAQRCSLSEHWDGPESGLVQNTDSVSKTRFLRKRQI